MQGPLRRWPRLPTKGHPKCSNGRRISYEKGLGTEGSRITGQKIAVLRGSNRESDKKIAYHIGKKEKERLSPGERSHIANLGYEGEELTRNRTGISCDSCRERCAILVNVNYGGKNGKKFF